VELAAQSLPGKVAFIPKVVFSTDVVRFGDIAMPLQALATALSIATLQPDAADRQAALDYPMREYIGGMSRELAQMARRDGDEMLAVQLERASDRAALPGPVGEPPIQSVA
jgi:hypothetical protein